MNNSAIHKFEPISPQYRPYKAKAKQIQIAHDPCFIMIPALACSRRLREGVVSQSKSPLGRPRRRFSFPHPLAWGGIALNCLGKRRGAADGQALAWNDSPTVEGFAAMWIGAPRPVHCDCHGGAAMEYAPLLRTGRAGPARREVAALTRVGSPACPTLRLKSLKK